MAPDLPKQVRRLLVRGLRARRHRALLARGDQICAIANREDVLVAGGLQGRGDDQLARAADSRPSRLFTTSGPRTPAAQTTSSDGMNPPSASCTPSACTSVTRAFTRMSTPRSLSRLAVVSDSRSGNCGTTRSAASISVILISLSGSMRSRPKATALDRLLRCLSPADDLDQRDEVGRIERMADDAALRMQRATRLDLAHSQSRRA